MLPPPYRLRPLEVADFDAVLALWNQTEGVGMTESDTPEMLKLFLERNPNLSLVVENQKEIAGAILCGHDGRRGFLYHLAVAPSHRRQGLANAMVEACLAALGKVGLLKCNILVYAHNESGKTFWKKHGWNAREDLMLWQKPTPKSSD